LNRKLGNLFELVPNNFESSFLTLNIGIEIGAVWSRERTTYLMMLFTITHGDGTGVCMLVVENMPEDGAVVDKVKRGRERERVILGGPKLQGVRINKWGRGKGTFHARW
jgi:hypothetical protein